MCIRDRPYDNSFTVQQLSTLYDTELTRGRDGQIIYLQFEYEIKQVAVGLLQTVKNKTSKQIKTNQHTFWFTGKTRMECKRRMRMTNQN